MSPASRIRWTLMVVALAQGFLSMGFQLLASRILQPWFGSSIIVWAYLISTFLAAFSLGSVVGGLVSKQAGPSRVAAFGVLAALAVIGFGLNAFGGRPLVGVIDRALPTLNWALFVACAVLFLMPVVATSSLPPLFTARLAATDVPAGMASGLVYGVSTVGNIGGVMLTALLLIPNFRVSHLLTAWLVVAVLVFAAAAPLAIGPGAHPTAQGEQA